MPNFPQPGMVDPNRNSKKLLAQKQKSGLPGEKLIVKALKSNPNSFENLVDLNPKLLMNPD